jgi:predicted transcriptional regulator
MPTYSDYLSYIRFADIHPQILSTMLVKKFGITTETAIKVVKGLKSAGFIYANQDIVILTDEGRKLCDESELSKQDKVIQ